MFFDGSNLFISFVDGYLVIVYLCQIVFNSGDWLF